MHVYIVTRNDRPVLTTLDEREEKAFYDRAVSSGHYRALSMVLVIPRLEVHRVLYAAYR